MIEITICGKSDLKEILPSKKFDAIISINDPDKGHKWALYKRDKWRAWLKEYAENVLCLYFHDATEDSRALNKPLRLPLKFHIQQIVDFCKNIQDKQSILIHCLMGVSRSTAIGIIVLMELSKMTEDEARRHVTYVRPCACPNPYMLTLYKEIKHAPLLPV